MAGYLLFLAVVLATIGERFIPDQNANMAATISMVVAALPMLLDLGIQTRQRTRFEDRTTPLNHASIHHCNQSIPPLRGCGLYHAIHNASCCFFLGSLEGIGAIAVLVVRTGIPGSAFLMFKRPLIGVKCVCSLSGANDCVYSTLVIQGQPYVVNALDKVQEVDSVAPGYRMHLPWLFRRQFTIPVILRFKELYAS